MTAPPLRIIWSIVGGVGHVLEYQGELGVGVRIRNQADRPPWLDTHNFHPLTGVSHECDYPPEVKQKTKLVECALDLEGMSLSEIDVAVSKQLGEGKSVYLVNEEKLKAAAPTILVTQDLCEVRAGVVGAGVGSTGGDV